MAFALAACEQGQKKEPAGTLLGSGTTVTTSGSDSGAAASPSSHPAPSSPIGSIRSRTLPIVAGTLAGAWHGRKLANSLDPKDNIMMQQSTQHALSSSKAGTKSKWLNADSRNSGAVTPQKIFTNRAGQKCREYQQTVASKGKIETAYGTACQQSDGAWKVASNP